MRWFLASAAVVAAAVLFLLGRYGTLDVCEMARRDMIRVEIAAGVRSPMLRPDDSRIAWSALSPTACLKALFEIHIIGLK